ncbi:MAG: hypothetical protein H8E55_66135 [Pelagibacterales bacterium]|nr:hypothetical protein [Pelagibacterales bacterium]
MNNFFRPSQEIKDSTQLYGLNQEDGFLYSIIDNILKTKTNIQFIGERKSGKSSLLNCIVNEIQNSEKNIIPVIINFKDFDIDKVKGNEFNVFSSCILNVLTKNKIITSSESFKIRNINIQYSQSIDGYLSQLINLKSNVIIQKRNFQNIIKKLAEKEISTIIFIDDYEYMYFTYFKGRKGSLYAIRNLVTKEELANNQTFQCCIIGKRRWSDYNEMIGSDDFNFIEEIEFIPALNFSDIDVMVTTESKKIDKFFSTHEKKQIFRLSGGNPYILKIICRSFINNGFIDESIIYDQLVDYFALIWRDLNLEMKKFLKEENILNTYGIREYLQHLNLINEEDSDGVKTLQPNGYLWNKFISTQQINNQSEDKNKNINKQLEVLQLANYTCELITFIANNLDGKDLDIIFDTTLSHQYLRHINEISKYCENKDLFKQFITAIYLILFESSQRFVISLRKDNGKTKNVDEISDIIQDPSNKLEKYKIRKHFSGKHFICSTLNKDNRNELIKFFSSRDINIDITNTPINMSALPDEFNRYPNEKNCPDIFFIIDIMRHYYVDSHVTTSPNFETKRFSAMDAQKQYLNHKNEPEVEEWSIIQIGVLSDFNDSLKQIKDWALDQV